MKGSNEILCKLHRLRKSVAHGRKATLFPQWVLDALQSELQLLWGGGGGVEPQRILTGLLCPNLAGLKNRLVVLVKLV